MHKMNRTAIVQHLSDLGISNGDTILVRANLSAVGRIVGGGSEFVKALQEVVGLDGTIVSLAFTKASFFWKPKVEDAFHPKVKSYAGALPNAMIENVGMYRSSHPMCSFVAIGKYAKEIIEGHDEYSPAYEPVRKIIELGGKCVLIGCVDSSPGFTTAHLAEADLGMHTLAIFSRLYSTYYINKLEETRLFRRKDLGLCSKSYYKFYSHYVKSGILRAGFVGNAYSIIVPAKDCYAIEIDALKKNRFFNVCESPDCFSCNANRWDRIYRLPGYLLRLLWKKLMG